MMCVCIGPGCIDLKSLILSGEVISVGSRRNNISNIRIPYEEVESAF